MQTYSTPFCNASVHFSKVKVTVNVCYEGKKAYTYFEDSLERLLKYKSNLLRGLNKGKGGYGNRTS